ncbi:MAG: phosphopantetheine-binding protein [Candidatus Accumulibacter sp.]|jgi:acyl carrier protein|nr:phosphopantetheine-binding protein [Accumulibacter sp.]
MDRNAAYGSIRKLLVELFEIDPEKITFDANLYQDLDIDSIDAIDLAVEFKKQTGRQLAPDEFKKIRTVGDVVDVVCGPSEAS